MPEKAQKAITLNIQIAEHVTTSDEVALGLDGRYWFTPQFLQGAALLSRLAFAIEVKQEVSEEDKVPIAPML